MRFKRTGLDKYFMAFFLGCGMILMGLSSTDKGWAVIGGVVVVGTLVFAALDIYSALRGPRESTSKPLPTPILVALCAVAVPGLCTYWYLTGDPMALLVAIVVVALLGVLFLLRNTGNIEIAKFSLGDAIPPSVDEQNSTSGTSPENQAAATHKLEFTIAPGEPPTLRSDDGSAVPLDIAIDSADLPLFGKEGNVLKGIVQAMRGNTGGALETFRRSGAASADLPAIASGETVALLTGHRYEEALAAADRAIAAQPSSGADRMLRGQALLALGATDEALADFQAAQRVGMAPGVETSIGAALFELGRTDEAITALEKGRGDAAASSGTFFYLGEAYRARGRDAEAGNAYDEAAARAIVELQYGTAWHRGALPMALVRQGKVDAAQIAANDAIKASATDPTVRVAQALIEVKRGTLSDAQAELEQALAVNPHEVVKALSDPDFASLLVEDSGKRLLERAKAARDAILARVRSRATAVN